jgi:ABC-2 type transport system ATP-binding protein
MLALSVKGLKKIYKTGVTALKSVSFDVVEGDFFALLGPNGAGKSTLISILSSLTQKTEGQVMILGHDIDAEFQKAKPLMGFVPQEFNFNIFYKVEQILYNQAGYYGISRREAKPRVELYLKKLGLWEKRNASARSLSGGMKRRLLIARALIHEPKILILDEPTAGVDIELRRLLWTFLRELNQQGVTIILTTHYLEEAEHLCRHIAIIDRGSVIEYAEMAELLKKLDRENFILYLAQALDSPPVLDGYQLVHWDAHSLEVEVTRQRGLSTLFEQLARQGIHVSSMKNKVSRLEELFVRLTSDNPKINRDRSA